MRRRHGTAWVVMAVALLACGEPVGTTPAAGGLQKDAGGGGEVNANDAGTGAPADTVPAAETQGDAAAGDGAVDAAVADADTPDAAPLDAWTTPDAPAELAAEIESDWGDLLDPPETAADAAKDSAPDAAPDTNPPPNPELSIVYAHTSSTLYKLGPAGFQLVGNFSYDKSAGQMTDIALDENGNLYGVTFGDLFACNKADAKCKWLASLPQSFNGLTFVPKGAVKPNAEALIAIANSGDWMLVDVQGGKANLTKLGNYGGGMGSSGDAFSVEGVGTYATVKQGLFGGDKLAVVDAKTGAVTKVVGDTGVTDLWGVAWTGGVLYGFAANGQVVELDMQTGKAKPTAAFKVPAGVSWWGAGVSTRAALGD